MIYCKQKGEWGTMFIIQKNEASNKTIRMPNSLIEQLEEIAINEDISFNQLVVQCCEYALANLPKNEDKITCTEQFISRKRQIKTAFQKYYVAEIGIKDTDPATVDVTSKDGLDIMTVLDNGDIWYVYHNTTNTSKTVVAPDDIYVVSQQKGALVQKGETVTIPAYGVVLSKNVQRVSGFYYGKTKAKNLVPGQNIT